MNVPLSPVVHRRGRVGDRVPRSRAVLRFTGAAVRRPRKFGRRSGAGFNYVTIAALRSRSMDIAGESC